VRGEPPPRRMASCVDVPRWANFRGHTCADYLAFNWCAGGRVLNASATGAIFGRPEWACCTCGAASAADVRAAGAVTNLFFIATHEVEDVDVRLFRYYQRALDCAEPRDKPHCAAVGGGHHASEISLWVLLYRSVNRFDGVAPSAAEVVRRDDVDANEQRRQSAAHGAEVAIWSERDVDLCFHVYGHSSVPSLHMHLIDRRHLGPTHAALAFKNLALDDALAVLREELQAELQAEAPAEPAAPPKPATTVPIKDRPFMRGTTSSGLASGA